MDVEAWSGVMENKGMASHANMEGVSDYGNQMMGKRNSAHKHWTDY